MTFIPAVVSAIAILVVWFYPLTTTVVNEIVDKLKEQRRKVVPTDMAAAKEFSNLD